MFIAEGLTIILITLKIEGFIDWNWFFVLLPEIIWIIILLLFIYRIKKRYF